jgi:DNA-directed RNA polymerase specialized sigma24 family protein
MVPIASIVTNYKGAGPEERLDMIFTNFPNFIGIVDGYTEGLVHLIASERRYNRRNKNGNPGIRIQKSRNSDITSDTSCENIMIRDSLRSCNLTEDILADTDMENRIRFEKDMLTLQMMRQEYDVVKAQMNALNKDEHLVLREYLCEGKDIVEIADNAGIAYESARQRIRRAKRKLKSYVIPFMREQI